MKKCPVCDKEFPDSMRFCQTDGTPLVEAAAPPEDPYKTRVGRQEDIASSIPAVDPFATMVNTSFKKDIPDDPLQLPDEKNDPLKTMFISEGEIRREMEKDKLSETPSSDKKASSGDNPFASPAPPVFSEPNITPPSFGEAPLSEQKTAIVSNPFNEPDKDYSASGSSGMGEQKTEVVSNPFNESPKQDSSTPFSDKPSSPFDSGKNEAFNSSPFGRSGNTGPIPSPFDASMPPGYQAPSAPLPGYKEPDQSSSLPKYEEPVKQGFDSNPFSNQPPAGQGPIATNDNNQNWNPPPAPDSNWQNQPAGQNTPSQLPVSQGKSKMLALASLICGVIGLLSLVGSLVPIVGIVCGLLSLGLSIAAIVTGFLARSRASKNPEQYEGGGFALGGIITGLLTLLGIVGLIAVGVILGLASFH